MANPTITELQNKERYELIAELDHKQIKEFVLEQLTQGGWIVKSFMIYQVIMLAFGLMVLIWAITQAVNAYLLPLYYTLAALIFCISFLIIIHELLHGIAIKLTGAKKVNYGAYLKKFIFYAEANQHVLNRKQFAFIALTPFVVIKFVTIIVIILFIHHPMVYFMVLVMCAHSLFCAGDIGLLSLFYKYGNSQIFTYDVKIEKKSYYFRRK
ncbi:DUF3267 domain-containing protein [Prolixibacteraceae bacterium Z1-6]|uniref:DUF3267 domain-containing protein n=1 Tax=Draconibacterium aestuarii TaxID=2998507 RepID=A0A9X3F5W6_9BACT|nr:DUF3267 domain-containing protein [Prolixibacteraceae bacterium Z1-6]